MTSKTASWKQKVDPTFDKIIKYFLQTLNQSDLPANTGWLALEDHYIKIMEEKGMQGWVENYQSMIDAESDITKSISKKKNEPLKERNKHLHDFDKDISESMKFLPEESREYYRKRFNPLFLEKDRIEYFGKMTKEELKDYWKDFVSDMILLAIHSAIGTNKWGQVLFLADYNP